jgi:hypothetical protein
MIWRGKRDKIPQPPISAQNRDPERHGWWTGTIFAVCGVVLLVLGARHVTGLETQDKEPAREHQLIKSFAYGALKVAPPPAPPDPTQFEDPADAIAALEKFEREERERPAVKYVVHTGAVDPCPT